MCENACLNNGKGVCYEDTIGVQEQVCISNDSAEGGDDGGGDGQGEVGGNGGETDGDTDAGTDAGAMIYDPCDYFEPSQSVSRDRSSGGYTVDAGLVDEVLTNPSLLSCDGSMVTMDSTGAFVVSGAGPDTMLESIGLSDGDMIVSINGIALTDVDAAFAAVGQLHEETSFELTTIRAGVTVVTNYQIR